VQLDDLLELNWKDKGLKVGAGGPKFLRSTELGPWVSGLSEELWLRDVIRCMHLQTLNYGLWACASEIMSLLNAHRHVASRGTCLRSSYLEISRFFRTRHHGITSSCTVIGSERTIRAFSGSRFLRNAIEPDENVRKTLDEFKATSMFSIQNPVFQY
jgi:hypothetical protein